MDEGARYLNALLDSLWLLEQQASAASGEAQDRYESGLIDEARAIAAGDLDQAPTSEHLRVSTVARTEVTALGDEVNEAARIEACAAGSRLLASKVLIERLDSAAPARDGGEEAPF